MAAHKYSRQRECIRQYLRSRIDHPSADMIYKAVRMQYPSISLGTVYRNLAMMVDEGQIIKINIGDGVDHFDARTDEHYHFACKECGKLMDLPPMPVDHLDVMAAGGFEGKIEGHKLFFYGLCPDCLKARKEAAGSDRPEDTSREKAI